MIYIFGTPKQNLQNASSEDTSVSEELFYIKAPDDINHDIATNVISANESDWNLKEIVKDDDFTLSEGDVLNQFVELVPPNLFIDRLPGGRLIPDMAYMPLVDEKFMDDMIYYWSLQNRADYNNLLDEMDDQVQDLINSCTIISTIS